MVKFNCKFCSYSLERETKPSRCPYCGRSDAMIQEENADKIISGLN